MSPLAYAPRRADRGATPLNAGGPGTPIVSLGRAGAGAVAVALVAIVALTTGGTDLGPNTWTEIVLVLAGVGAGITWLALAERGSRGGSAALAMFSALAVLTALSTVWSVAPDQTWIEAGRTTSYLAIFAAAVLVARLAPARWPALVGGIALAASAVSVWAVVVKVLTLSADGQVELGRLLAPFSYWNATGLMAALGLPAVLWAASRREGPAATRGLAVPALTLLITVVLLSYSRSALAAAVLGVAVILLASQVRLRAVVMLAVGGIGAAIVGIWAFGDVALTHDSNRLLSHVSLPARRSADTTFGLILGLVLLVMAALGLLTIRVLDRNRLEPQIRRRIGVAMIALGGLAVVALLAAVALSSRGFTGEISHVWGTLTSTSGSVGDNPDRLVDLANSRPRYWRQGLSVGEHHLLAGAGVGAFGVAHLRYSTASLTPTNVQHAHSYVIETFADLGLVGIAVNLALLLAWGIAARRPTRLDRASRDLRSPERDGMLALLGVVVAFGTSSAVDWTWFFPGVAAPMLLAAGWLAGRGSPHDGAVGADPAPRLRPHGERSLLDRPGAILASTLAVVAALAIAYAIWQPLRSQDASNAGTTALIQGNGGLALADEVAAESDFPVAIEPLFLESAVDRDLGRAQLARAALVKATMVQPQNPLPWSTLGDEELGLHDWRAAVSALRRARALDVTNATTEQQLARAEAELRATPGRHT